MFLKLEGAFRDKLKKAVQSGVPATFTFYIELSQVRSMWPDKGIADLKLTSTIKYDNLKKEYKITRSWKKHDPSATRSFEEAHALMTELNRIELYPLKNLVKSKRYRIRTKAEISRITFPLYLHYILIFPILWDFETDWYSVDFIY